MVPYEDLSRRLMDAIALDVPPVAVSFHQEAPLSVPPADAPVPAGCKFWEIGSTRSVITGAKDHRFCSVGVATHNIDGVPESQSAELQQTLGGFGMRYAIESGVLAARSLTGGTPYETAWRERLKPAVEGSIVNRAIYDALGNRGYGWLLRSQAWSGDTRGFLRRLYQPGRLRRVLLPWARRRYASARRDESCNHVDCRCVWCRCGRTT